MAIDTGMLDQVTQEFLTAFQNDSSIIAVTAKSLFFNLCLIQLTVSALWMALSGEGLQKMFLNLLRLSLIFTIFYACILNGNRWVPDLINGFIQLGQQSGVTSIDPSSIFTQGLSISGAILQAFFGWGLLDHPFVSIIGAVVCISVVIIYALIAAELVIVLAKSYYLVSISSLFFSFAACDLTRPMTLAYLKSAVGLGLQLMTLYFLIGVGQTLGSNWAAITAEAASQHLLMPMLMILAAVIVYYMIIKNLPVFVAGLSGVGGFRNYGAAAAVMAINAGMTGASHLGKVANIAGGMTKGGAQTLSALTTAGIGGIAATQGSAGFAAFKNFSRSAASHLSKSTFYAAKDVAMQRNRNQTFGQKVNEHLMNRVYKREE